MKIVEVGPRDGLQNESRRVSVEAKVSLINALVEAGARNVECGSFVSAKWVPQMAESGAVFTQLERISGVVYSALVPNLQGLEEAARCGVEEVAIFASASELFSRRNINCSIDESLERVGVVASEAAARGMRVRGYVSCVLGCPYEGEVALPAVEHVAAALMEMGCYEISLGDTIGIGTPRKAQAMVEAVAQRIPVKQLAVHFHDTWGQALANILATMEKGIEVVDSSVGGLGGCPFAMGAAGNVATEDLVYMLDGMRIETGIDLAKLAAAGRAIMKVLGRETNSKAALAIAAREKRFGEMED
jgi:isopropylmalate/homocitrate/citramalate synthase